MEVDYHGSNAPLPELGNVSLVLEALSTIGQEHPTNEIRSAAHRLKGHIDDCFNMINHDDYGDRPTYDEESSWMTEANALVDLIREDHRPEPE